MRSVNDLAHNVAFVSLLLGQNPTVVWNDVDYSDFIEVLDVNAEMHGHPRPKPLDDLDRDLIAEVKARSG